MSKRKRERERGSKREVETNRLTGKKQRKKFKEKQNA